MKMVRLLGWSSSSRRLSNLILGWLWLSNIICSVTAQTSNTSDQSDNKQKDLIVILVFFGVLILAVIGIIVFYVIRYKTQEPELRLINQLNIQKEVEHLAENMVAQLGVLLRLPWRQPRNWRWNDWASWLLLLLFIGSGVALIVGVALPDTDDDSDNSNNEQTLGQLSKRSSLLLVSAFGFVMSVNLFLITRQHLYYKCKREAFADDARFRAISETSFGTFDRASWYNRIQILVIAFEFFQLISFPLRDLLQSNRFSTDETASPSNATKFVDAVIRIVALLPQLSSVYFYVQFWTITGGIILGLAVAFLFHLHNKYARLSWPIFWVSSVVPIVGVLYLPVMTTYINSVACLTKHAHESLIRTQRCPPPSVYANFYLLFSLLCYIIAYLFLTVFLTSYDRTPVKGDISFKSSGVAFFDNLDMLLVIDFLLLPDKDTRLRGIFSILILLALVCYNIRMRPCYVRPINYWRTASLCCILWTALLVPIINDEKLDLNINVAGTVSLIVVGWVVIVLFFFFVRYCYRAEPYDPELEAQTDTDSTNPSHLPPHKRLVTAVSSFQSLLTGRSSQRSSAVDLLNGRQAKHRRSTTDHHKQSTSNNFLNVESALERAMSRARPPPWKDPWAPLPPYYRQYQASSRRRRYNAERRAPIGIPNTPNYLSIRVNGSTGLFPHDISNQRRARTEVNGIYEDSEDEVVEGSRVMEDPTWATLHPNYQARMSMPDIPTFIIQQQEQEQQQQQQQQQQTVASQPIMAMPEPYDGHGPPMSTVLGGHSSTEPWPSDITEETVYLSENQQVYNTTLDTPSTATPLLGSMNMPSATLHRQQILQATQQQSSGRPLGRSRSRSMPGPPTWLNDLNELSRVTERTENPDDTINNSSTIHNSSTIYNSSNILLL